MPGAAPAEQDMDFSDGEKEAFVKVYTKVNQIQQKYQAQLKPDATATDVEQVTQKAQTEMVEAINKEEGIDVNLYNRIVLALESSTDLRNELQQKMQ